LYVLMTNISDTVAFCFPCVQVLEQLYTILAESLHEQDSEQKSFKCSLKTHRAKLISDDSKIGEMLKYKLADDRCVIDPLWYDELKGDNVLWVIAPNRDNLPKENKMTPKTLCQFLLLLTVVATQKSPAFSTLDNCRAMNELVGYLATVIIPHYKYALKNGVQIVDAMLTNDIVAPLMKSQSMQAKLHELNQLPTTTSEKKKLAHRYIVVEIILGIIFPDSLVDDSSPDFTKLLVDYQKRDDLFYIDGKTLYNDLPSDVQKWIETSYNPPKCYALLQANATQPPADSLLELKRRYYLEDATYDVDNVDSQVLALITRGRVERGKLVASTSPGEARDILNELERLVYTHPACSIVRNAANDLRSTLGASPPDWWYAMLSPPEPKDVFSMQNLISNPVVRHAVEVGPI
jgi:hypothetical protein